MRTQIFDNISLQRVFLVIIIIKVICSVLSWLLNSPWIIGLAIPLLLMAVYIVFGLYKPNREISDERFADSCYYLGFVFTISSIVVSLFDLQNIGSKIGDISIRFGAAMISTVLGLIVRVYLVNFRQDFKDALNIAEDGLLESARNFRIHLEISVDNLRHLEITTNEMIKSISNKMEESAKDTALYYSDQYAKLFEEITSRNQEMLSQSQHQLELNSITLDNSFKEYSLNINKSYQSLEVTINQFSDNIDTKLKSITFPDDYFVSTLTPTVVSLAESLEEVSSQMKGASVEIRNNNKKIGYALNKVAEKTEQASNLIEVFKNDISNNLYVVDIIKNQDNIFNILTTQVKLTENLIASNELIGTENKFLLNQANDQLVIMGKNNNKVVDDISNQVKLMENINEGITESNKFLAVSEHADNNNVLLINETNDQLIKIALNNERAANELANQIKLMENINKGISESNKHLAISENFDNNNVLLIKETNDQLIKIALNNEKVANEISSQIKLMENINNGISESNKKLDLNFNENKVNFSKFENLVNTLNDVITTQSTSLSEISYSINSMNLNNDNLLKNIDTNNNKFNN